MNGRWTVDDGRRNLPTWWSVDDVVGDGCGSTWLRETFSPFCWQTVAVATSCLAGAGTSTTFILKKLKILSHPFSVFRILQSQSKLCFVQANFLQKPFRGSNSASSSIVLRTTVIHALSRSNLVDMPPALPQPRLDAIKALLELGLECNVIASRQNCSEQIVRRIKQNIINYGTPRAPKAAEQGRKRLITPEMEEVNHCACDSANDCIGTFWIPTLSIHRISWWNGVFPLRWLWGHDVGTYCSTSS